MTTSVTAAVARTTGSPLTIEELTLDKPIKNYGLADINTAFGDSANGSTVKPVVVF